MKIENFTVLKLKTFFTCDLADTSKKEIQILGRPA
jgi:hypothetical protein